MAEGEAVMPLFYFIHLIAQPRCERFNIQFLPPIIKKELNSENPVIRG